MTADSTTEVEVGMRLEGDIVAFGWWTVTGVVRFVCRSCGFGRKSVLIEQNYDLPFAQKANGRMTPRR